MCLHGIRLESKMDLIQVWMPIYMLYFEVLFERGYEYEPKMDWIYSGYKYTPNVGWIWIQNFWADNTNRSLNVCGLG